MYNRTWGDLKVKTTSLTRRDVQCTTFYTTYSITLVALVCRIKSQFSDGEVPHREIPSFKWSYLNVGIINSDKYLS